MPDYLVSSSAWTRNQDRKVTTVRIEAARMQVTQAPNTGAVLSLVDAGGDLIAVFQDWDYAWIDDGTAELVDLAGMVEAPTSTPPEGLGPRPEHRA